MATNFADLEKNLWSAADNLRANSDLKSQEYSTTVLGLIFLKYADTRFTKAHTNADKMSDIFKMNKEAMHALIVRDRSRNQYMLNI